MTATVNDPAAGPKAEAAREAYLAALAEAVPAPEAEVARQAYITALTEAGPGPEAHAVPAGPGTEAASRVGLSADEAAWAAHDFAFRAYEAHRGVRDAHPELEADATEPEAEAEI